MSADKIRVVIAKTGIDDHYRGIVAVSEALRDAGMEVIYLGMSRKVDQVVAAVMHEDADAIGLGFHCGGHMETMQQLIGKLREQGLERVLVIVGGIIPGRDILKLKELGVGEVFLPGSSLRDIAGYVLKNVKSSNERQ